MTVDPRPPSDPVPEPPSDSTADALRGTPGDPFIGDRLEEDAAEVLEAGRVRADPRLQWPLMSVLVGLVVSLLIVASDHFRRGSVLFALFVGLAFVLRLVLADGQAGWLAVRGRRVDLIVLGALAGSLMVFAAIVPPPS